MTDREKYAFELAKKGYTAEQIRRAVYEVFDADEPAESVRGVPASQLQFNHVTGRFEPRQ